jgi:hypothetical protein
MQSQMQCLHDCILSAFECHNRRLYANVKILEHMAILEKTEQGQDGKNAATDQLTIILPVLHSSYVIINTELT